MSTGILPLNDLKRKCHSNTGFFETSQYTEDAQMFVTSGNHDAAGLSIGNLQYNFGPADRAQEWFKFMIDNHMTIVNSAFGANTSQRDTFINVINTYTRADRITWGDSISALVNGEKRALVEPYKSAFGNMLISAEGKVKYYAMADAYYWTPIYEVFRHLGCKSRAACASLFDTYVNKGRFYPINLIQADFDAIDANNTLTEAQKEAQKIYQINYRGNYDNAVNPNVNAWGTIDQNTFWHGDGVDDGRRGCMANQEGVYYGAVYDPENQFDINQEPATDEKAGEKPLNVNLGAIQVQDAYLGTTPIKEIYLGATLIGGGTPAAVTSSRVPVTQFRTNPASYAGIGAVTSINLDAGKPLWIDVQEPFVGCRTYYTLDGSTPTTSSTLYTDALTFDATTTLKVLTVSVFGVAAAVKTLTVNVAGAAPVTTISPSATVQNTIPITVTLSTSEAGAAIKYRIGTDATVRDYTAPFTVSQNTAGVLSTQISIYYWAVGANATEAEKSITYDTSGALPAKPTLTATAGAGKVDLSWTASQNATAFTIYRSTVAGTLGTWIGTTQYYATNVLSYTDTAVTAGTTYYYTIRAGNYGQPTDSDQKAATPTAAVTGFRYIRIDGFGEYYSAAGYTTSRMIEVEIFSGGVNVLRSPSKLAASTDDTVDTGAEVGSTTPTRINDAVLGIGSNTYNIWWGDITLNGNAGNGWVKFDLGSAKTIDSIRYWAYPSRAPRFKIWGTNDLADFGANGAHGNAVLLWDMSANTATMAGATAGTNNYIEKVGGF